MPQNRGAGLQHLLGQDWRKSSKWSCRVQGVEARPGLGELPGWGPHRALDAHCEGSATMS